MTQTEAKPLNKQQQPPPSPQKHCVWHTKIEDRVWWRRGEEHTNSYICCTKSILIEIHFNK